MSKAGGAGKGKGSTKGSDAQGPSLKSLQDILKQHQVKNSTMFLEGLASIGIRVAKEHKGKGKGKGKTKGDTKPTQPQGQNQNQATRRAKGKGSREPKQYQGGGGQPQSFLMVRQD